MWAEDEDPTQPCKFTFEQQQNSFMDRPNDSQCKVILEKWHFCPTLYIIFILYTVHISLRAQACGKGTNFFLKKKTWGKNITGTLSNASLNEKDIAHSNTDFNSAANR